ncbi:Lrp/AsnC family transcriptional regulator [Candidatus Pacearchaeota archaeon]|nr:Lrp/AsnC family transcriptional regulator [Candidatus Pacearchaeota archaeon]
MGNEYINWAVEPVEGKFELKSRDKKIIDNMLHNSRISLSELGKKLRLSKVAIFNRIKNLESRGVIMGYSCFVDFIKLGYSVYQIGVNVNMTIEGKNKFGEKIKKLEFVNQVLQLSSGKWNYLIRIICKEEMIDEHLDKVIGAFGQVRSFEVLNVSKEIFINKGEENTFESCKGSENLTKLEVDLLYELARNSRGKIADLAGKFNCSAQTIVRKIKELKKRGIIFSLFTKINPFVYGNEMYIFILTTKNRGIQEKIAKKLVFIKSMGILLNFQNPNIISFHLVSSLKDLVEIEEGVKDYFDKISDCQFIRIESQLVYNIFPEDVYRDIISSI